MVTETPERRATLKLRDTPPLTIDPAIQFGRVCINGTRVPATSVAWGVWGEPHRDAAEVADDYGVSRNEVLLACWWLVDTGQIHDVPGQLKRKRKWTAWCEHAQRVFGGWDKRTRRLCNPDEYDADAHNSPGVTEP